MISAAEQRRNRIAMWRAEILDPTREESITPLEYLLNDFEADVRADEAYKVLLASWGPAGGEVLGEDALLGDYSSPSTVINGESA